MQRLATSNNSENNKTQHKSTTTTTLNGSSSSGNLKSQEQREGSPPLSNSVWTNLNAREEQILIGIQKYRHPLLDVWFKFWSEFGEELGFIVLLPSSAWFFGKHFISIKTNIFLIQIDRKLEKLEKMSFCF